MKYTIWSRFAYAFAVFILEIEISIYNESTRVSKGLVVTYGLL